MSKDPQLAKRLQRALHSLAEGRGMPRSLLVEPGSFLAVVAGAWNVDGRRKGEITQSHVARLVAERLGQEFDRYTLQVCFGSGKKFPSGLYHKPVGRSQAQVFLEVALLLWRTTGRSTEEWTHANWTEEKIVQVATRACDEMFAQTSEVFGRMPSNETIIPELASSTPLPVIAEILRRIANQGDIQRFTLGDLGYLAWLERLSWTTFSGGHLMQAISHKLSPVEVMVWLETAELSGVPAELLLPRFIPVAQGVL